MTTMNEFVARQLNEVRRIVLDGLKGHRAHVYLFGSRARGDAMRWSDIDVAIEPLEPLPPGLFGQIDENLEESRVVYNVDVVDLSRASIELRNEVQREGVLWTV
jgi:predicted nucleotidyltransferase